MEQFIGYMEAHPLWPVVVHFLAARLAGSSAAGVQLRHGERLTKPSPAQPHHRLLAQVLGYHELVGVVTTNYDVLAERTLRHRPMVRPRTPGFYYAGLPNDPVRGSSTFSVRHKWVELTGAIPLYKLHGSLNWTERADSLRAYVDFRPAFRLKAASYIVAPKPEKQPRPLCDLCGKLLLEYLRDQRSGSLLATASPSTTRRLASRSRTPQDSPAACV